jgi:hypothetical protein
MDPPWSARSPGCSHNDREFPSEPSRALVMRNGKILRTPALVLRRSTFAEWDQASLIEPLVLQRA